MNILSKIEKVTEESFLFILFDGILLVSPGLMAIFYFYRETFLLLDTIKLILLSIAITLPIVCWNILLLLSVRYRWRLIDRGEKRFLFIALTGSLWLTNYFFGVGLFLTYLLKINFWFTIVYAEIGLTIIILIVNKMQKKKKNLDLLVIDDYISN